MSQASVSGASADEALAKMGYKGELPRNLSMVRLQEIVSRLLDDDGLT